MMVGGNISWELISNHTGNGEHYFVLRAPKSSLKASKLHKWFVEALRIDNKGNNVCVALYGPIFKHCALD